MSPLKPDFEFMDEPLASPDAKPPVADKAGGGLPSDFELMNEMPAAEPPVKTGYTGIREWLDVGKRGVESAIETGLPTAAGIVAGAAAMPAGPGWAAAAYGTAEDAVARARDWFMRPDQKSRDWLESGRNIGFGVILNKFGPQVAQAFLKKAQNLTGSSLHNLIGTIVWGSGEAATAAAAGGVLDTAKMIPEYLLGREVTGPSIGRSAVESVISGLVGVFAKPFQKAMEPSTGAAADAAARLNIRGTRPGDIPERMLAAPNSAKRALEPYFPGSRGKEPIETSTAAIQRGLERNFPVIPLEAPSPNAMGPFPDVPTMGELGDDLAMIAGGERSRQLMPYQSLPPTKPKPLPPSKVQAPAKAASAKFTADALDAIEPGLGSAKSAGKNFGSKVDEMTYAAERVVGNRIQSDVDKMVDITGNKYIPAVKASEAARELMEATSMLPESRAHNLARKIHFDLNSTSGGKGMLNAREMSNTIQQLNEAARSTKNPRMAGAATKLEKAFQDDLMDQIGALTDAKTAAEIRESMKRNNIAYLNIKGLQKITKGAKVDRRLDPDRLFEASGTKTSDMSPELEEKMQELTEEFLVNPAARAPKDAKEALLDPTASKAPLTAEDVIYRGSESTETIPGQFMATSNARSVSKFLASNEGKAIRESLSPHASQRLDDWLANPNNQIPREAEILFDVATKAKSGDPFAISQLMTDPKVSAQTVQNVKASGMGIPRQARAMGSASVRGAAMPSGKLDIGKLEEYVQGLDVEGNLTGPTKAKLQAAHTPEQLADLEDAKILLDNIRSLDIRKTGQQSLTQQLRSEVTGPGGMGGSVGYNVGGRPGKIAGWVSGIAGATMIPRLLEYLATNNWSQVARDRVNMLIHAIKTQGATTGGEVMK